jgi:hypothetical protein
MVAWVYFAGILVILNYFGHSDISTLLVWYDDTIVVSSCLAFEGGISISPNTTAVSHSHTVS